MILTFILVFWLAAATTSAFIASAKNRDSVSWFFIGIAGGIFAVIAIAAVPPLEKSEPEKLDGSQAGATKGFKKIDYEAFAQAKGQSAESVLEDIMRGRLAAREKGGCWFVLLDA